MILVAGVDVGNKTTEVTIGEINNGRVRFLASALVATTGIKGTTYNVAGIRKGLELAAHKAGIQVSDLELVRLNEAAPVIGDVAMETITETIITESTMIGHNPATPGGLGLGVGMTFLISDLPVCQAGEKVIVIVPGVVDFVNAANSINQAITKGVDVQAVIAQRDDGVLIANRLEKVIPIVDEVRFIEKIPIKMQAAVEVASQGQTIKTLSNPYGIATIFNLNPEETKLVVPVAKALMGNRSAVVIRTPQGDVQARRIPAGKLTIIGAKYRQEIDVGMGAKEIMQVVGQISPIEDVTGEPGTNVGGMLERVKQVMGELTGQDTGGIKIKDLLAVDTMVSQRVQGGLAEELAFENAVALAAMVKTSQLPMRQIAHLLKEELGIPVEVAGVEAEMAVLGALTTPGTEKPLIILDMGAGSTDAAFIGKEGEVRSIHLAGAGDMVTMLINSELQLNDLPLAEDIKCYPLAKVESLFHIRLEDGSVKFFSTPLPAKLFARVVVLKEEGMLPIPTRHSLEEIHLVRQEAKQKVFITNSLRALELVSPTKNIRSIDFVVLVGGSALDFEIPTLISKKLAELGVVCGAGNIRGTEGPRNAVATGLVLSYLKHVNVAGGAGNLGH